ncbi:MAG TPA: hypothetical protein ENH23_00185 [candidate division Zixibacteria bacterium]|nr:hypothetical protein [candidate division Zixibacteria bacterium]
MKRVIIVLIIAPLIYMLSIGVASFGATKKSELPNLIKSNLTEKAAELSVKKVELYNINLKLVLLRYGGKNKTVFQKDFLDVIDDVSNSLQEVIDLLDYESQLILTIPHLKDEYKNIFSKIRIEGIRKAKELMKIKLKYLNYIYSQPEYKSVLLAVGDPIKTIQSSIELFDKVINDLQFLSKKE